MYRKIWGWVIFTIWCLTAIYGVLHHEFWRDEMRALSIAIQAPTFFHLPEYLINEGHPLLWYVLLKTCYLVFNSTHVLAVLSLFFAAGIASLLLIRSPFPIVFSIMIIFGTWCLYDYGINCRNYGIGAFLFLLFADIYSRRQDRVILSSVILALAAQTNVYAAMMAVMIGIWMAADQWEINGKAIRRLTGFGIILISFFLTLWVTIPNNNTRILEPEYQSAANIYKVWDVGYGFVDLLFVWFKYEHELITAILWLSILVFLSRPKAMLLLFLTMLTMSSFSLYFRNNFIQHQGIWIYVFLTMMWVHYKAILAYVKEKHWAKYLSVIGLLAFSMIIMSNMARGLSDYMEDLHLPKSDSKAAGEWLRENVQMNDIIISEPDYIMESVMYYHYQPFFLPRERVFNSFVHFTKSNDQVLELRSLLNKVDSFNLMGKTTYLILGKRFYTDTIYRFSYQKQFIIDSISLNYLNTKFQLLDSFTNNWFNDEQYFIFRKKKHD
jgi:hypothetical protein